MPYLLAALAIGLRDIQRSLKISALPIALAIATAALVAHHPGTPQMAVQICSSLGYTNPQSFPGLCNGAIAYIGRDTQYARTDVINGIHAYHYYRLYGLLAPLVALPILMAFVRLWRYPSLRRDLYLLATIALLSIAASTPLFLYGEDWGRWIYVHTVCIFLLLLFIDCRRQLDPATTEPQFTLPANRAKRVALILLLIAYATCWDLPHVGIYQSRTGYFGLAHYFYQYRSTHPSQPNAAQLP
jgi:hypothetical protein